MCVVGGSCSGSKGRAKSDMDNAGALTAARGCEPTSQEGAGTTEYGVPQKQPEVTFTILELERCVALELSSPGRINTPLGASRQ